MCFAGPVLILDGSGDKQEGAVRIMAKCVADFIDQLQAVKKQTLRENGVAYLTPIKSHTNTIGARGHAPAKRAKLEPAA